MRSRFSRPVSFALVLVFILGTLLAACSPAAPAPQPALPKAEATTAPAAKAAEPTKAPEIQTEPTKAPAAAGVVNRAGVKLPADAAPLDKQVMRYAETELKWLSQDASFYDEMVGDMYSWHDSCARPDASFNPQPSGCESWSLAPDNLTWTFKLPKDKVWSDGAPITAEDWVFTLQRYARPDYDFEWFYGMSNIANWNEVVKGEKPPEELGAKVIDDQTFQVVTDRPTPYLPKIFADLWVAPKHVIKDRLNDGSWAFDKNNWVFAGPYKLESYDKGKGHSFVANDKYTGPFPPMLDRINITYMDPQARWAAYKNGELDSIGGGFVNDLPPSAMAEIYANPELKKQLISWPNFMTYYLFFDTWNKPFDDVKVRQAFSHAVDRDALANGPLQYQAVPAYTMNPPGFPGENVAGLKDVQKYDPELAKKLFTEAGYPEGKDFPKLTLYTRAAMPALTAAAESMASMLKENLGVEVEIQNLDYSMYMDKLRNQKKNKSGDMNFALVSYEFDFVDGSNMLSPWGGCEKGDVSDKANAPGRHTWYNKEFNELLCDAGSIMGDEAKRNGMYKQAEKILVDDVALVPVYHPIFVAMVKPDIAGPMFTPNAAGIQTWDRFRFSSRESKIYRSLNERP